MKLKSILPERWYLRYIKPLQMHIVQSRGIRTYSQEGEDRLTDRLLGGRENGFYIDIGAHHPRRFSNTYYFYRKGWSGINIEPNPELYKLFSKWRPRDINLNAGLYSKPMELKYYYFEEPALNTFSEDIAAQHLTAQHKLVKTENIAVTTLSKALEGVQVPEFIDFMNIDTEGSEWEIIRTNDWTRIRPELLLIELKAETIERLLDSDMVKFLKGFKYRLIAKLFNTVIFRQEG